MGKQIIDHGNFAGDENAEVLYTSFEKVNDNFTELYSTYNHTSTQWSGTIADTAIPNGAFVDLMTLISDADKVADGTVARDEYSIATGAIIIPYIGQPYEGCRLHHIIRVNFDFLTGNAQTAKLQLRRKIDDSIIGQSKAVTRDPDFGGIFEEFVSYTNGATDAFTIDGFYVAVANDSGATMTLTNSIGILVQTTYEKPTLFI